MKKITSSPDDTRAFGLSLALKSKGGEIYGLIGDLGGGKTTFTKGFAEGLKLSRLVASPTFILMNVFPVSGHPSIRHLCHVDAYRMRSIDEAVELGIREWLGQPGVVTIIEWADTLMPLLKTFPHTLIHFTYRDEQTRQLITRAYRPAT